MWPARRTPSSHDERLIAARDAGCDIAGSMFANYYQQCIAVETSGIN